MQIPLSHGNIPTNGYYLCIGYKSGENSYETDVVYASSQGDARNQFKNKYSWKTFDAVFCIFQA